MNEEYIKSEANIKIPINDFSNACKSASKTGYSIFKCGKNSLKISIIN